MITVFLLNIYFYLSPLNVVIHWTFTCHTIHKDEQFDWKDTRHEAFWFNPRKVIAFRRQCDIHFHLPSTLKSVWDAKQSGKNYMNAFDVTSHKVPFFFQICSIKSICYVNPLPCRPSVSAKTFINDAKVLSRWQLSFLVGLHIVWRGTKSLELTSSPCNWTLPSSIIYALWWKGWRMKIAQALNWSPKSINVWGLDAHGL